MKWNFSLAHGCILFKGKGPAGQTQEGVCLQRHGNPAANSTAFCASVTGKGRAEGAVVHTTDDGRTLDGAGLSYFVLQKGNRSKREQ